MSTKCFSCDNRYRFFDTVLHVLVTSRHENPRMDHPTGKCVVRRCYDPHPWHSLQFVPTQKLTTSLEYIHPEISGTNPTTLPPDHLTNQSQGLTITVGCLWPGGLGGEDHAFRVDAVAVERLVSAQAERALHALELPVLRTGGLDH